MKYCTSCGNQIMDNSSFCPNCGKVVGINNYKDAVIAALSGDNRGFEYLYNTTANDKYYIALKYMKNQEDADDVLQDAYIKAWNKLDTLDDPEKFPSWIGMIVANTAKNALQKKNPVLFTELENDEGEIMELQIEDESVEANPELSLTNKERTEVISEMLGALSEDQRLCITMFYLEDRSIKEIAEILECSENTVKSRLNYGRKNLTAKGKEMEKKGYQFFSIAPLPLLIYLVRQEAAACGIKLDLGGAVGASAMSGGASAVSGVSAMAGSNQGVTVVSGACQAGVSGASHAVVSGVTSGTSPMGVSGASQAGMYQSGMSGVNHAGYAVASNAGKTVASKAAGGFFKTIAGKIVLGVGVATLAVAGTVAIVNFTNKDEPTTTEIVTEDTTAMAVTTENVATPSDATSSDATPGDAVDEKALLQTYYQDVLIPEYGLMPEYQANNFYGEAIFSGIYSVDIDDYNGDGTKDLFISRYNNFNNYASEYVEVPIRNYKDVKQLFTVKDSQVVLVDEFSEDVELQILPYPYIPSDNGVVESGTANRGRKNIIWKVITNDEIYIVKLDENLHYDVPINYIYVYTYKNNKLDLVKKLETSNKEFNHSFCFGYDYIDGVEQEMRYLFYPNPSGDINAYIDAYGVAEEITEEDFLAELGINCVIDEDDKNGYISIVFNQDNKLIGQVYNGGYDGLSDYSVNSIYGLDTDENAESEETTETKTFEVDYSQLLTDLKNNGLLPTDTETINFKDHSSNYNQIKYAILDINGDGNDELLIYDSVTYYMGSEALFAYGFDVETGEVKYLFNEKTNNIKVYDNGYVICSYEEGQGKNYDIYKFDTNGLSHEKVYEADLTWCGAQGNSVAPEAAWSQDNNGNEYIITYIDENGNRVYEDDDYPEWFQQNVGDGNLIEITYTEIGDY